MRPPRYGLTCELWMHEALSTRSCSGCKPFVLGASWCSQKPRRHMLAGCAEQLLPLFQNWSATMQTYKVLISMSIGAVSSCRDCFHATACRTLASPAVARNPTARMSLFLAGARLLLSVSLLCCTSTATPVNLSPIHAQH